MKNKDLSGWRMKIDDVDNKLIKLLAKRNQIARRIARTKMTFGIAVFDAERETQVIRNRQKLASVFGLKKDFVQALMRLVMKASKEVQKEVMFSYE